MKISLLTPASSWCSAAVLVFVSAALATETRTWSQSDAADFGKGVRKNLSIRSDGRLSVAPRTAEVFDSSSAYLWTLAADSKGNLYTAGGPGAKLYRIPAGVNGAGGGKGEKIADFDALEIHAIAIDPKDRIYVATAPDGKIYRVDAAGKSTLFYDPKQKYIWQLLCDPAGNIYIATGDQGEIHKVTPEGKGEVFFKSDETHARSIAFDRDGNLICGTEPGGLVIRISPQGEGFVLYQMPKREVTALAIGPKNQIYAAAVGSKNAPRPPAPPQPPPAVNMPGAIPAPVAPVLLAPTMIPGGSDVYLIPAKEQPTRLWTGAQDVVYALALDAAGRLLLGSGNKGNLYRLEDHSLSTTLVSFPTEEITALLSAKDGTLYAATGNVGKVFRVGPGLEAEGSIESDVFDSGGFTTWGPIQTGSDLNGGKIAIVARSGNLDRPQKNWSPWSDPAAAPPARFLQWKATLQGAATLDSIVAAYLRQNVAPRIEQVEITPYNYRFPTPSAPLTLSSAATLTLPAIGAKPPSIHPSSPGNTYPAMTWQKGALGVRWTSSDENGDSLLHTVEIRGAKEKNWKLLRDKVYEKYLSFDSTAFPDGDYRLRITASDSPSNTPDDALTATEESDPFTIDNTPPAITQLRAAGNVIRWRAADALSMIYKAEYALDGADWTVVDPVGRLSGAQALEYALTLKGLPPGEHTVAVRVSDSNDNTAVEKLVLQ